MATVEMIWPPADGAGPAGQFHAAEMVNVLRSINKYGVYGHTLSMTVTGSDRNVTVPAFTARVPNGSGGTTIVSYAGGTATSSAADATNPRIDILTVDAAGNVGFTTGTPTAETGDVVEAPMPALASDEIMLAKCRRPANVNAITTAHLYGRAIDISELAEQKGSDVASASTLTVPAGRNYVHVTGTTGITAIASRPAGEVVVLEFDGACALTYNATSLILAGAADYTTAAGDVLGFISEGSGNWRQIFAPRALPRFKYRTAQLDLTSATLADVAATSGNIAFAVAANTAYRLRIRMVVSAVGTQNSGGLKLALTGPSSPTRVNYTAYTKEYVQGGLDSNSDGHLPALTTVISGATGTSFTTFLSQVAAATAAHGSPGGLAVGVYEFEFFIVNGANAGTVTLQAAQNTGAGTTSITAIDAVMEQARAA